MARWNYCAPHIGTTNPILIMGFNFKHFEPTKIWSPQKLPTIQHTQHVAQQVCNVHYSTQQVTVYNRSSTCTYGIYFAKKLPPILWTFMSSLWRFDCLKTIHVLYVIMKGHKQVSQVTLWVISWTDSWSSSWTTKH